MKLKKQDKVMVFRFGTVDFHENAYVLTEQEMYDFLLNMWTAMRIHQLDAADVSSRENFVKSILNYD